ncbi:MAG: GDSL-type esterase/lipase family protein [bacterium]|nr:GDSL-type esterase/lipase family protein [bacterium]
MKAGPPDTRPLSRRRRALFTAGLILIPILVLAGLETGLRLFRYGGDTSLFVPTPDADSPYYGVNRSVGRRYFRLTSFNPSPRKDLFLREKPGNGFRVFVLGESSAAGFPYGNNVTFPRILNRRLADAFPERRVEVVNTAMTAVTSYTLLDFMDEILAQEPDALVVYAGHNEFYGALGAASMESLGRNGDFVRAWLKLRRFRTFVLVRDAVGLVQRAAASGRRSARSGGGDAMETEMSRIADDRPIPLGSPVYESAKRNFRRNLGDILRMASDAGVPVFIGDLVSNVRDQAPFISVPSGGLPAAGDVFRGARGLEAAGRFDAARAAYVRAKDLDGLRFRATEEFNAVIREEAARAGATLVEVKAAFESASPNGLVGFSLMHEHLHPNIDGYFRMADAFFNAMLDRGAPGGRAGRALRPSSWYRSRWGFTALDSASAALLVHHLRGGWPFRETGPNTVLESFRPLSAADSIALDILRTGASTLEQGHMRLGEAFLKAGRTEEAFAEYKALVYTVPNLDLFYEPALKILLDSGQYGRGLEFVEEGLRFNESAFMWKWAGQLRLALGNTAGGIAACEKALALSPGDGQVVYNLSRAYYNAGRIGDGDRMTARFRGLGPNPARVAELEAARKAAALRIK